jgi:hypothetical protein
MWGDVVNVVRVAVADSGGAGTLAGNHDALTAMSGNPLTDGELVPLCGLGYVKAERQADGSLEQGHY